MKFTQVRRTVRRALDFIVSASLWLLLAAVGGLMQIVLGVYLIAGAGWAFIAGGLICLLVAVVIQRGLNA